ncbi:MAG: T9SS type A sorting domain-containing protein [Saprospiraceae bacterium]|nr:T9SS type A sorting domain-containing protein [Saprospiraceae bacterium]
MKTRIYTILPATLLALFVFCIYFNNANAQQIPELLYYKFDSPGTTVQNSASSPVGSNPATISGMTIGSTGLSGTALVGTGASSSTSKITTGWSASFTGSWTIAFWTSNIVASSTLWYIWGDPGASGFRCFTNGAAGANNWLVRGGGLPDLAVTGAATSAPNMIHIVRDYTAGTYKSYKNGVLITTVSTTAAFSTAGTGFTIGGYSSNSSLNGNMDEFRIYNRALSQAEITATYNIPLGAATDAGLTKFIFPSDTICSGNNPVSVRLKNFGPNSLSTVNVNWKVNNISQTAYTWNGSLASGDSVDINIGTYNFLGNSSYSILTYTSNPNGTADTVNVNDTINKSAIYVNVSPMASVTPSGIFDICQNDSIILTANTASGLSYQWMNNYININGETDSTLIVKQAGNYNVKVTNSIGCSTISDTVVINVLPIPQATASALGATTFCLGDSVFLMANPGSGLTYQWKRDGVNIPGGTLTTMYVSLAGAYTVTTTHPNSCSNTSTPIIVTVFEPPINLGPNKNICPTHQITLDAGVGMDNYLWSTGDTTQTIVVDSTGFGGIGNSKDFSVTVTQQSCTNSDTITLTLVDCTGIPENLTSFGINIYPNPSTGKINFDIPADLNKLEITIYNTIGQIIFNEQITSQTESLKTIDLSNVPKGVYFIGLKSKEKQNFVKVILN